MDLSTQIVQLLILVEGQEHCSIIAVLVSGVESSQLCKITPMNSNVGMDLSNARV